MVAEVGDTDALARALWALVGPDGHLTCRVQPRARRPGIALSGGQVRIAVSAPPEGGKANAAVLSALARALGVPKTALKLVRGARGRDKVVQLAPEVRPVSGRRT